MAIERLYRKVEQDWIIRDISQEKRRYAGINPKIIHYFRPKAEEYNLFTRVKNQFLGYRAGILQAEELTTNEEIAKLFQVARSSVSRYLEERALKEGKSEHFKERITVLKSVGGSNGGHSSSTKGYKQKKTWSRKKK